MKNLFKFRDDARNWYKWHSTYVWGIVGIFPIVWLQSPELQAMLPAKLVSSIAPFIAALGFTVNIRKQILRVPFQEDKDK